VLTVRSHKASEGQVREHLPFQNKHGLKAAVGVYEVVVQAVGADKVTAKRRRETVKLFPGELALNAEDDMQVIAQSLVGAIKGAEPLASNGLERPAGCTEA
jgi:hypothetical protein